MAIDYTRAAMEEYDRISIAWRSRTIALLGKPFAQTYIAIFRSIFRETTRQVPDDELYSALDSIKAAFDQADLGDAWPKAELSGEDGRTFCRRRLMQEFGWIQSIPDGTRPGHELYGLSQNAMRVMNAIDDLVDGTEMASGDLMATVLQKMDRLAAATSSDREEKLNYLRAKRDEAQRELDEYVAGGVGLTLTDAEAEDSVSTIVGLLRGFPVSFVSLAAELDDMVRHIDEAYEDGEPIGRIGEAYFKRSNDVLSGTKGGRNFRGVNKVLTATARQAFEGKVYEIASSAPLKDSTATKHALRAAWDQVVNGQQCVLLAMGRARDTITSYNLAFRSDERQVLRNALLRCDVAARRWASESPRGAEAPADVVWVRRTEAGRLRSRFANPAEGRTVPPVVEAVESMAGGPVDSTFGEPNVGRIAAELIEAARRVGHEGQIDVAELWQELPSRDSRLADAVALCLRLDSGGTPGQTSIWRTSAPDGTESVYEGPRLLVDAEAVLSLAPEIQDGQGTDGRESHGR